jgi:hypothetical protein
MENILLTRDTLHSNIKLGLSLVKLFHSDSDHSGWLAGCWLGWLDYSLMLRSVVCQGATFLNNHMQLVQINKWF